MNAACVLCISMSFRADVALSLPGRFGGWWRLSDLDIRVTLPITAALVGVRAA
jgi:hypothetical protein